MSWFPWVVAAMAAVVVIGNSAVRASHRGHIRLKEARALGLVTDKVPEGAPVARFKGFVRVGWMRVGVPGGELAFFTDALVMRHTDMYGAAAEVFPRDQVGALHIKRGLTHAWLFVVSTDGRLIDLSFAGRSVGYLQDLAGLGGGGGLVQH